MTLLDADQVIKTVYDSATGALKTTSSSSFAVEITAAAGDSIAIGDQTGTNYLAPNADGSLNVVVAGESTSGQANAPVNNIYSSTNVTTGAYVQLVASTSNAIKAIELFDSSGQILFLATGGAGVEANLMIIFPGGNGRVPVSIPAGTRLSVKAISATANSGNLLMNFWK